MRGGSLELFGDKPVRMCLVAGGGWALVAVFPFAAGFAGAGVVAAAPGVGGGIVACQFRWCAVGPEQLAHGVHGGAARSTIGMNCMKAAPH
jgi:hypothetical protein